MDHTCATCARPYDAPSTSIAEKPLLPGRHLHCCGRSICSRCLNQNKRYETYCPYCQITTTPSLLPQGLRDPPAYEAGEGRRPQVLPSRGEGDGVGMEEGDEEEELPAYSTHPPPQTHLRPAPEKSDEPAPDVLHFLSPNDSIHSLGLAYGVPMHALRKTNNLYSDALLPGRRTVLIPGEYYKGGVSLSPRPLEGEEEEKRKVVVRRWMVGCKSAEYDIALLYLKQCDWDLDAAIAAYKDDERWEREHPLEAKRRAKMGKGKSGMRTVQEVGMRRFVGGTG